MHKALQQARAEAAGQAQTQGTPPPALIGTPAQTEALTQDSLTSSRPPSVKEKRPSGGSSGKAVHMSDDIPADAGDNILDSAAVNLIEQSQAASEASSTELLPSNAPLHKSPTRGLSLMARLGSSLLQALSLPSQASYSPISGEDDDAGEGLAFGSDGDALGASSPRRALPRDASYIPEWLNKTLRRGSMLGRSFSSARSSGDSSYGSDVSRAESTLPEWVDMSSLQQPEDESALPAAFDRLQQQSSLEVFAKALKPVQPRPVPTPGIPASLVTAPSWPPTEAQASAAASKESRSKRLKAFWEQQQPAAAAASERFQSPSMTQQAAAAAAGLQPAVNLPPAHAVHAHSRALPALNLLDDDTGPAQQLQASPGRLSQLSSATHSLK